MGGGGGGLFGLNCECVACLPERPAKRGRRPWPRPAAQILATAPGEAEPLFLLERLAHIRCFTLTLCGPPGTQLLGASVRVSGTVVDALCELGAAEDACGLPERCLLRLDVGEPIDAAAVVTLSLADGYAYVRLPLLAAQQRGARH